jgi:hypothetical protein
MKPSKAAMKRNTDVWRVWAPVLAGLFFVATIMAPVYGPLVDHHFAERDVFHNHIAVAGPHLHAFLDIHSHPMPRADVPDLATAVSGEDGVQTGPIGVEHSDDLALLSRLQPPVGLDQPVASLARTERADPTPPLRPPRPFL